MTPPPASLAQIEARSKNGKVQAIRQREVALQSYNARPNLCKACGIKIEVPENIKIGQVRAKQFCNSSCAARFNNPIRSRLQRVKPLVRCEICIAEFRPKKSGSKYCSHKCAVVASARNVSTEERRRRGLLHADLARQTRYKQLELEEGIANEMRTEGWEIFSPTVVCDRIGIKDGEVFFLEFKPKDNPKLRAGQKRICDLVPEMYKIVLK